MFRRVSPSQLSSSMQLSLLSDLIGCLEGEFKCSNSSASSSNNEHRTKSDEVCVVACHALMHLSSLLSTEQQATHTGGQDAKTEDNALDHHVMQHTETRQKVSNQIMQHTEIGQKSSNQIMQDTEIGNNALDHSIVQHTKVRMLSLVLLLLSG